LSAEHTQQFTDAEQWLDPWEDIFAKFGKLHDESSPQRAQTAHPNRRPTLSARSHILHGSFSIPVVDFVDDWSALIVQRAEAQFRRDLQFPFAVWNLLMVTYRRFEIHL